MCRKVRPQGLSSLFPEKLGGQPTPSQGNQRPTWSPVLLSSRWHLRLALSRPVRASQHYDIMPDWSQSKRHDLDDQHSQTAQTTSTTMQGARARPVPSPLRLQPTLPSGSSLSTVVPSPDQLPSSRVRGRPPARQSPSTRVPQRQDTGGYASTTGTAGPTARPTRSIPPSLSLVSRSDSRAQSFDLLQDPDAGRRSLSPGGGQDVELSARSMSPPLFSAGGGPGRRSITPSLSQHTALMSPIRSDLEVFAQHCKAW